MQRTADAFEASAQLCLLDAPGAVVALLAVLECKADCSESADDAQSRRHRFGHAEREQFAVCRHGSACQLTRRRVSSAGGAALTDLRQEEAQRRGAES